MHECFCINRMCALVGRCLGSATRPFTTDIGLPLGYTKVEGTRQKTKEEEKQMQLTDTELKALFNTIDTNIAWAKSKGCTINDFARFMKIVVAEHFGFNKEQIGKILGEE